MDELSLRRENAFHGQEQRQGEAEKAIPELSALLQELAQTNVKLSKIILEHPKDSKKMIDELRVCNLQAQEMMKKLLTSHGYPQDYLALHFNCPKCEDTGFIDGARCICLKELLKKMAIEELNSVSPLQLSDFASFDLYYFSDQKDDNLGVVPRENMKKIVDYCEKYAETFSLDSPSILMLGPTGLGKTHLSLAVARKVIEKSCKVLYCTAQDILRTIEREHFSRDVSDDETLSTVLNAELLILDDLGAEHQSAFHSATVYNIINTRLSFHRPTIISSNLTSQELENRYSERVVSRLFTQYTYLRFVGEDVRQLKRKKKP